MSTDFKTSHYLLEGMLDAGLPFVGIYLEKKIGKPAKITDAAGRILYPDQRDKVHQADELFINIPAGINPRSDYELSNDCLYFQIQHNSSCSAYVIIDNIAEQDINRALSILKDSRLALKYHFFMYNEMIKNKEDFAQSLYENFFLSADVSIPDKLKMYEQKMDINNYYFVSLWDIEEGSSQLDWKILRSYIYETMNLEQSEYVSSIMVPGRIITIFRGNPKESPMDIDPDWPGRENLASSKEAIEKKFNIIYSQGLGRIYRPSGLLQSYQEACIAVALPRLMGQKGFIQYFSQLGVFSIIFSHEPETVRNYCYQVLGRIIEHDQKYGTDLLDTLRILLDNSCSWTTTANQMYVHVNTVYYRMFKVQKLLNVDFSLFETRLHLYTAIRAWDTLNNCSFPE
jgi:hypothetical protein